MRVCSCCVLRELLSDREGWIEKGDEWMKDDLAAC